METSTPTKLKFTLKKSEDSYNFFILHKGDNVIFTLEDLKDFPIRRYELKTSFEELKKLDENFFIFRTEERLLNGIKKCIDSEKYSLEINEEEKYITIELQNEFFEKGIAKIKVPEKDQDLKEQVESLTKEVC